MKRPAFQFYPDNWRNNSNLRRCSWPARGAWIEVMCLMHDADEYGALPWSLKEIAQALGCPLSLLRELATKGVMKGCDEGECEAYIYTPRSGRKVGAPVTLVAKRAGPFWYSSRMVRDEYVRAHAGAATRFGSDQGYNPPVPQSYEGAREGAERDERTERAKLRARVLEKTGGFCHHCGDALGGTWEIDHFIPRSKGGRHEFSNLVPSCVACNQDKSDTLPAEWCAPDPSPSRRVGEDQGAAPTQRQSDGPPTPSPTTYRIIPFGNNSPARKARLAQPEPAGFAEFWGYYPAKVGKAAARKAWGRAVQQAGGHELLVMALKARLHLFPEDAQFIPNPATWLNQGRWDDDPETLFARNQRTA
jgi:hypothetical protein